MARRVPVATESLELRRMRHLDPKVGNLREHVLETAREMRAPDHVVEGIAEVDVVGHDIRQRGEPRR